VHIRRIVAGAVDNGFDELEDVEDALRSALQATANGLQSVRARQDQRKEQAASQGTFI
jgi:hypothetical protein